MANFKSLYSAGRVKRYHTADVQAQTLAQHSWGVAMIVARIYPNQRPTPTVLMAALTHDLAEMETGDVPAPTKWNNPKLNNALRDAELSFNLRHDIQLDLTVKETDILHWADTFELCLYCSHQINMGDCFISE